MNDVPGSRSASTIEASLALACARVLAAFCALELVLPRAGRAAAGLLLRRDSAVLRWFETTGEAVEGFAAKGIMLAALAAGAAAAAAVFRARNAIRAAAAVVVVAAACWVFARRAAGDSPAFWWPVLGGAAAAGAALLVAGRSASAAGAAVLQAGVFAFAAWALAIGSGGGANARLDRVSEGLVLGGIALAGLAAARPSRERLVLALLALALPCAAATAFPEASHAVVRHLVAAGNSGLPFALTAGLLGLAAAGIVLGTAVPGLAPALFVALVCARRPEAWLVAGGLASSLVLLSRDFRRR